MLHYVSGDILLSSASLLAHGVAPNDHFSSGLALALRERWPAMVKDFRHWCHQHSPRPGDVWIWSGPGIRVAHLLTQDEAKDAHSHPGRARSDHVNHALRNLARAIEQERVASLALPRIGTGVGGLDWEVVKPLFAHHLGGLKIPVYVYESYRRGERAAEPPR
ncbi:MAG: macro domain-containing protein [Planctomycetes bacterium]|nr:macro domain-containing protein [Planctomycetota bacterium]